MKLNRITQCGIQASQIAEMDLIIACCGYEQRSISLLNYYGSKIQAIPNKCAIVYNSSFGSKVI